MQEWKEIGLKNKVWICRRRALALALAASQGSHTSDMSKKQEKRRSLKRNQKVSFALIAL